MPNHVDEFERIKASVPDLVSELIDKLDEYAEGKETVSSRYAGSHILDSWDRISEWQKAAGGENAAGRMFGLTMWHHLTSNGWRGFRTKDAESESEYYLYSRE